MRLTKVIGDSLLILLTLTIVPAAALAIYSKASFLTVTSRSMEPAITAGDTLITRQVPRGDVAPREIIVLPVPDNPVLRYAHRVVSARNEATGTIVKTKGDANPSLDSWTMRITSDEVPRVIGVIPTSAILNGPISRASILIGLLALGALLLVLAIVRLIGPNR